MLYLNKDTKEFGISFQDALRQVDMSVPIGTTEFGSFVGYSYTTPPTYNPLTHTVVEALPKLGEQQWKVVALPTQDSVNATESFREGLKASIQAWRDTQENGGVEYAGHAWDTDEAARGRIQSVLLSGVNPLGYWTSKGNENVPMTIDNLRELWAAIVSRGAEIHVRQRAMKDEVATLSGDALLNYVIE